jgi:ribonuclease HI
MELRALIHAIKWINLKGTTNQYTIYSDSAYCVNMCNSWIWTWASNNWQNSKKQTVENYELVKELYSLLNVEFPQFTIEKCSGHIGIVGNELADALASNNSTKFAKIKSENNIKGRYEIFS